jgi:hypothetical protein
MSKNMIWLGPVDGPNTKGLSVEGIATEACVPGSVLDFAAANAGLELADDAATVFGKLSLVADKDQMRSLPVTTAWTIGGTMVAIQPRSGELVNVLVITGQAIKRGTALCRSATPGALKIAATDGTDDIFGYSDEIITTDATELVRVRIA